MIENTLKSVYKYMRLCIIGILVCTVYTASAYAGICFLSGNDCVTDITSGSATIYEKEDKVLTEASPVGDRCTIAVEPENEICEKCADGNFKNCECAGGFERSKTGACVPVNSPDAVSDSYSDRYSEGINYIFSCPKECRYSEDCQLGGHCARRQKLRCQGFACEDTNSSACITPRYAKCKGCATDVIYDGIAGCRCHCGT
ncbi:MAG: hypothetical protein VZR95_03555 [Alphaproteobacteria bacterium]